MSNNVRGIQMERTAFLIVANVKNSYSTIGEEELYIMGMPCSPWSHIYNDYLDARWALLPFSPAQK
eukprot:c3378_g2_i1 orf=37-234(-)